MWHGRADVHRGAAPKCRADPVSPWRERQLEEADLVGLRGRRGNHAIIQSGWRRLLENVNRKPRQRLCRLDGANVVGRGDAPEDPGRNRGRARTTGDDFGSHTAEPHNLTPGTVRGRAAGRHERQRHAETQTKRKRPLKREPVVHAVRSPANRRPRGRTAEGRRLPRRPPAVDPPLPQRPRHTCQDPCGAPSLRDRCGTGWCLGEPLRIPSEALHRYAQVPM